MKFDFFTFGGSVFWEDVFFYQKWRIQRHCYKKTYRLLDSWDIRRASGSFETCQKAFIKYINSYELTKQQGSMVILLHGYGEGKNIFKNLWRKLMLTNSTVAAINYPSLFRSSLASAYQILFFLNHIEDINEVSFVTNGAGSLVLRNIFNLPDELQSFRKKMRIGSIVEINPIVEESSLCSFFSKFKVFRFFGGPMLDDFMKKNLRSLPSLPKEFNVLDIYSTSIFYYYILKIFSFLGISTPINTYKKKHSINIKSHSLQTLKNEELLNYTVKFISNGKI